MARWKIDPDHSVAAFAVKHFMITDVRGQFNQVNGTILFDPQGPFAPSLQVEVGTGSLFTGIPKRDHHLRSPDFFHVAEDPVMTFTSGEIKPITTRSCRIAGVLKLRAVSRELILHAEFLGPVRGPDEFGAETCIGCSLSGSLNREDFGLHWNRPMKSGGTVVGWEVRLQIHLEADLAGE